MCKETLRSVRVFYTDKTQTEFTGIFHKWHKEEGSLYGIIEKEDGLIELIYYQYIQFKDKYPC
jgi:hypothetical protein